MANTHYSILDNASHVQISGGTFHMGPPAEDAARDRLEKHIAPNALPDSDAMYDGPKCYPETRKAIHRKLGRWIRQRDDVDTKFIWLQGGAGAGKSAIMRTTALGGPGEQDDSDSDAGTDSNAGTDSDADADTERNLDSALDPDSDSDDSDKPHVLGSFFFSRQDSTRNTARSLIPTLALQLCNAHPAAKAIILKTIAEKRELIFTTSLLNQVRALLIWPLIHLEREYRWLSQGDKVQDGRQPGRVFVIDGLDECAEPKKRSEIIEALAVLVKEIPVRVLLASRPDEPISTAIRNNRVLRRIYSEISLSDDPDSSSDIRLFLEESLREVRRRYISKGYGSLPDPWPTKQDIKKLVDKSSQHFIYASTAEKYISSGVEPPDIALRVILGLQVPRTGQPFEELDALYRHILGNAQFQKEIMDIISFVVFEGLSRVGLVSYLLGCRPCDIHHFLSDLSALVIIDKDIICLRHKSFADFLRDKARTREFYIGTKTQFHCGHLEHYFTLLDAYRVAASNTDWKSILLVKYIAKGIAASPLSDSTTALVRQHPPQLVHDFLLPVPTNTFKIEVFKSLNFYMKAIAEYGFVNSCAVYQDSLKDFIYHYQETPALPARDDPFNLGSICTPLLLVGFDIQALQDIYIHIGLDFEGKLLPVFPVFDRFYHPLCKPHRHPVHILRQIHKEMVNADNNLEAAALKMLRMVTKCPGQFEEFKQISPGGRYDDFYKATQALLKAIAFVLPKIVYCPDIAIFAAAQLPDPLDIVNKWHDPHTVHHIPQCLENAMRRARRAMDVYLQRGGHPAISHNAGDSEIDSGTEEISSHSNEQEASSECDSKDEYAEANCRICKKIRGEEAEEEEEKEALNEVDCEDGGVSEHSSSEDECSETDEE